MKRPLALALFALVLAAVFLSVSAGAAGGSSAAGLPGPAVGRAAPGFSLAALQGQPVTLASLRGAPAVINFWATWCEECRAELPVLQGFAAGGRSGAALVGVDVDEPAGVVGPFAQQQAMTWPVLLDAGSEVTSAYGVHWLPTTFFVDAAGVIRRIYTGPLTPGQLRAFVRAAQ